MENYDSTEDTKNHITKIQLLMGNVIEILQYLADVHDKSKLHSPEKEMYDEYTPKLSSVTYGSDQYKQYLKEMGVALQHHYQVNSHHPEHYEEGIDGMTLFDVIEMFCDWKAASMRHSDGSFVSSLEYNKKRFNMSDQLYSIFTNTADILKW